MQKKKRRSAGLSCFSRKRKKFLPFFFASSSTFSLPLLHFFLIFILFLQSHSIISHYQDTELRTIQQFDGLSRDLQGKTRNLITFYKALTENILEIANNSLNMLRLQPIFKLWMAYGAVCILDQCALSYKIKMISKVCRSIKQLYILLNHINL